MYAVLSIVRLTGFIECSTSLAMLLCEYRQLPYTKSSYVLLNRHILVMTPGRTTCTLLMYRYV